MFIMNGEDRLVKLKDNTIKRLEARKHPGQTWDGTIAELLDHVHVHFLNRGGEEV